MDHLIVCSTFEYFVFMLSGVCTYVWCEVEREMGRGGLCNDGTTVKGLKTD